jgi:hypothetical protein
MVASSAFADCHHWAERYVVPPYQRCNPAAADAASAMMAALGSSVSLAQTRLSAAVTERTSARGDWKREIMGAWVDPVGGQGGSPAVGQRTLIDSPRASIVITNDAASTWANRVTDATGW